MGARHALDGAAVTEAKSGLPTNVRLPREDRCAKGSLVRQLVDITKEPILQQRCGKVPTEDPLEVRICVFTVLRENFLGSQYCPCV